MKHLSAQYFIIELSIKNLYLFLYKEINRPTDTPSANYSLINGFCLFEGMKITLEYNPYTTTNSSNITKKLHFKSIILDEYETIFIDGMTRKYSSATELFSKYEVKYHSNELIIFII